MKEECVPDAGHFVPEVKLQQPVTARAWLRRRLGFVRPWVSLGQQCEPKEGAARAGLVARGKKLGADVAALWRSGLQELREARPVVQPC